MTDESVLQYQAGGVTTLTLNRADNKNALSADLVNGLADGIQAAIDDPLSRVIVLTNADNTFCAGADLKANDTDKPRFTLVDLFQLMQSCPKPIVGKIAGHCMGGGVGLAAVCDISVAADDVLLGFTEVRIGVAPAIISVVCLPKMRRADAMELFLSGERISAQHAANVGLINYAVAPNELDNKVNEITAKLVRGGPVALSAAKELVLKVPDDRPEDAFGWTAKRSMELFKSDEAREGIAAFRDKRDAAWVPKG